MELKFSDLLHSISESVQQAGKAIEQQAAELYFNDFEVEADGKAYQPIVRMVMIPDCSRADLPAKKLEVPMTVLCHHNTMALEAVDIKLKFIPSQKDGELYLTVTPDPDACAKEYSEVSLSYQSREMPEGIARVNQQYIKTL